MGMELLYWGMIRPDSERADGDAGVAELNTRREMLDIATQETRFTLIQDIVSHPEEFPSLREF